MLTPPSGSATTFTWDGNGNTLVQIVGSARTTYTWDDENRLLGVLFSNGQRQTYSYAADGLRRKKIDVTGLQSLYVWDEENLLLWTDQNFNFQNQYTQYPGQWGGMVSERHTGSSFFYGFDLSANTRFMAQISGSITDHYLYRAFGDGEVVSGSNFNPYQFGGQYGYYQEAIAVEGSQRYYVRARHLRVDLGRWLSRDRPSPFLDPAPNLYHYVGNLPLTWADPSGLQSEFTDCGKDPCKNYIHPAGWYDNNPALDAAIRAALHDPKSKCQKWDLRYLSAVMHCIVTFEINGAGQGDPNTTFPLHVQKGIPVGPCQLVPGRDKDRICGDLQWKQNLQDYMKCCIRILCLCLGKRGDLVKGCGTKGSGRHRTGEWQTINQSQPHLARNFKCCLSKDEGIKNPTSKVPRAAPKKPAPPGRRAGL